MATITRTLSEWAANLRYEDLHAAPDEALCALLAAFGWASRATLQDIQGAVAANRGRVKTRQSGLFRKGSVDSFRQELESSEIRQIERSLRSVLRRYRYPRRCRA